MNPNILKNVLAFMERAEVKGIEAYHWCEAHMHIQQEIAKLSVPSSDTVPENANSGS